MPGRYLTDMAQVLRNAGLPVFEEPGWETRARSSGGYLDGRPKAIMWHHTASNGSTAGDIAYMVRNSGDRPISNLYLARNGDVHVLAAGATNTNGKGGPLSFSKGTVPIDTMNTHSIAIEAANDGVGEPWPQVMIDNYFKINNALTVQYGMQVTDLATHNLWAPTRKVDPAKAAVVQGPWKPGVANSYGTWSTASIQAEAVRRATVVIPPPEPPQPKPEPPPDTRPPLPPDQENQMRLTVAKDANGAHWVGDGLQRRWIDDEAVFNNYVVLANAGAYQLVNTSGQQVRGFPDVREVGQPTIEALGAQV